MAELTLPVDLEWEGLDEAFAELEATLADTVRGLSVLAWNRVLHETPQFYGRLVASWTYSYGAPVFVDRSSAVDGDSTTPNDYRIDPDEGDVFAGLHKGHPAAIGIANFASAIALGGQQFKLGDTVWFANGADHGEGPYASEVERGEIGLRPVNQPGRMASRALDWVQARFGVGMTETKAADLRSLRLGG